MNSNLPAEVGIIDFGGQYTHLIARRIRKLGVLARIYQPDEFDLESGDFIGLILSGSPQSVEQAGSLRPGFSLDQVRVPVLGLCYGQQLIASISGGTVMEGGAGEYGLTRVQVDPGSILFKDMEVDQVVWMSHRDHVNSMPEGYNVSASSDRVPVVAFENPDKEIYGLQFHPEVSHTREGMKILDNFLARCTEERDWTAEDYLDLLVEKIRLQAGDRKLMLLLSGGVDSLVTLALCIRAVGEAQVHSIHVDTGYMRLDESEEIVEHLGDNGYENLKVVNASADFYKALEGVVDPEGKRKIVGRLFVEVLQRELVEHDLSDGWMLVQGTIYPDTIESGGTRNAATIKTHHNRVAEIDELIRRGLVIEPLIDLYKDEVRELGNELKVPDELLNRQPFPGPGLVIRILGSERDKPEEGYDTDTEKLANICLNFSLMGRVLPVRSVGVQGDSRTYSHPALVWSPEGKQPIWKNLQHFSAMAVNRLDKVNRVVYSIRPMGRREFFLQKTSATKEKADLLRKVDALIRKRTRSLDDIWQMPVISLPLFNAEGDQVFVMRPVTSRDAMTADVYPMDPELLEAITAEVLTIPGVGALWYDITTKPPATIEWE